MKNYRYIFSIGLILLLVSCVTTRKTKDEVGWIGTKWHDMNARYNGFFNAKELYRASNAEIVDSHVDNYNQILTVFQWGEPEDRESVVANMDIAIEKVTKVAALHEPSKWVDDSYVLMGKAQLLKGDLESAQETFEYFVDDFNPKDPDSRVYVSPNRENSAKARKKEAKDERKIVEEERKKEKKEKEKTRKQKEKDRKAAAKQREKDRKQRIKDRKSGKKATPKKIEPEQPKPTVVASTQEAIPIDPDEAYIQELEAKEAQKKEVDVDNGGGFLKHKPAYFEGVLWLAKTYIARDRWIEANYFLDKLEKEPGVPDHIMNEVPTVRADYFLQQKDYNNAIPALSQAIESSKDRKLKARLSYILAQVYQQKGEASNAYAAFEQVDKFKPSFEMSIQSEINKFRNSWSAGNDSTEKAVRKLNRLGKEDKYAPFRGSIYSAAAEILLASGDQAGAMEYFQKALSGDNNKAVQTEIYYRLGSLFFGNRDYLTAKNYFDSTLLVMPEKDERFIQTKIYSENLTDIAKNILTINLNDSLLMMGAKPKRELQAYAKEQALKNWKEQRAAENAKATEGGFTATTSVVSSNSKFFAYNPTIKSKGKQAFLKRWGTRSLQDNWRLSSKLENSIEQEEEETIEETIPDAELEREINKILREIPQGDEQIAKSNKAIEDALFELGTGFRTNLEKFEESNQSLEKLLKRYPSTIHAPEAYFFMYLNHIDLDQKAQSEVYRNKLMSEYPQSDFAIYLQNPDGSQVLMTDARRIELDYNKAYKLFEDKHYEQALEALEKGIKTYGDKHTLAPKFELLKAMCLGNLKGEDEYINALRSVILRFNNTPEQAHARELIRFLRGDQDSFAGGDGAVDDEALKNFTKEDGKLHYVIVVLYDSPDTDKIDQAKTAINEFNEKNFKEKRLRATSLVLNREKKSHIILVRRFSDKDDSMAYFTKVNDNMPSFLDNKEFSFDVLAINQKNYRQVMKDKAVTNYRAYFDLEYIGDGK